MATISCLLEPVCGFFVALLHTPSVKIQAAQIELGKNTPVHRGSLIPLDRLTHVLNGVRASLIQISQIILRLSMAAVRRRTIPPHRFVLAFKSIRGDFDIKAEVEDRGNVGDGKTNAMTNAMNTSESFRMLLSFSE